VGDLGKWQFEGRYTLAVRRKNGPYVRAFFARTALRLKTHGVENWRRFSTPKTDMAEKKHDDDDVDATITHLYSCNS